MAVKTITETSIQADVRAAREKGKRLEIRDKTVSGLMLRISPRGACSWFFVYWRRGAAEKLQLVRMWLGVYGTEAGMGIADARKAARAASEQRDNRIDPVQHAEAARQREKEEKAKAAAAEAALANRMTLRQLVDDYVRENISKEQNRYRTRITLINSICKAHGDKAFVDLTEDDVLAVYHDIRKNGGKRIVDENGKERCLGAKSNAKHVFDYARSMLNWAEDEKLAKGYKSPLRGKTVKRVSQPRERVMTVVEIRTFWDKLDATGMQAGDRLALRLELLLGQRIGEILAMRKAEIDRDEKVWRIPASRAKNGKAHVVPLPPMARKLIYERMMAVEGQHLFPNSAGGLRTSQNLGFVLLEARDVFGFKSEDGQPNPVTTHDLRRTCNSKMRDLGVPEHIRAAALNQAGKLSVNEKHYTQANPAIVLREVREALTLWDAALDAILKGADPFASAAGTIEDIEARARARLAKATS